VGCRVTLTGLGTALAGKVAIVTGAGSSGAGVGSGKAISVLFAQEGASVMLLDEREERAEETYSMIKADGGTASVFAADVTKAPDCEAAVAAAIRRYGRVDILVNNVGVTRRGDILSVAEDEWDSIFAVNLKAMMLMSKFVVPAMVDAGGGAIINLSSTGATKPPGGHIAYDTSKGGVIAFTVGLAVEQGRNGIRVNAIMPGRMITPMVQAIRMSAGTPEEVWRAAMRRNLLGTEGTAWDVAGAAVFLASDRARWITAVTLPVDGGFLHMVPDPPR
jgi:NAD(P)-dependent dehydrogenase (short-subunit alcohol dehydrogenase family)